MLKKHITPMEKLSCCLNYIKDMGNHSFQNWMVCLQYGKVKMKEDDPDYPTNDHGKLECVRIAIDAQTGEILSIAGDAAPKQKKIKGIEKYQGYISWGQ